ncbi:class I SAM-dependent methyltransferase [Cupriavidus sp. H18C1]|uniref:class I SAM-dependent methyltransferase n=1 Tax=Cupriavidus sp. H18C1 TaxID=3241601 RepID=UPI003BB88BD3
MDMLRESGSRSDAHVFRYQLAARFVRPGDVVLDAASGLGYGSHLIWTGTKASKVIGIDGSEYAAKYASSNFGYADEGLEFREGFLPQCLHSIPDNSVDLVVSFETLEHVEDPEGLLAEFDRVLAPGGRFIGSVPNDWSDETGEDPNPFHLHVYTLEKFRQQLRARFAVEKFFSQTADRVKKLGAKCEWVRRPPLSGGTGQCRCRAYRGGMVALRRHEAPIRRCQRSILGAAFHGRGAARRGPCAGIRARLRQSMAGSRHGVDRLAHGVAGPADGMGPTGPGVQCA